MNKEAVPTLYIKNLNDRIKIEGKRIVFYF